MIWGLRLTLYILWRNWGKGEDYRYQAWREQAGAKWWWSFFKVFLLQGFLMWVISAPLLAAQISSTPARLTLIDFLAVLVWGVGFFFEAVGDWQLARFKADPSNKGKLLISGVWRYTRHPNYFGDAT
jgi:steroid 5-alpha reductase family enzyme